MGIVKRMIVIFVLLITATTFMLAENIYRYETGGWVEETNSTIASATAEGPWNTGGYIILPSSGYQVQQITWNVTISQWIWVDITYTNFDIHVDLPGNYAVDNISFNVKSNGWVGVDFISGGNLTNITTSATIESWIGIEIGSMGYLPALGSSNSFVKWASMDGLTGNNLFTDGEILAPSSAHPCGGGEVEYMMWFGFRVAETQCKGDYTTSVKFVLTPDP